MSVGERLAVLETKVDGLESDYKTLFWLVLGAGGLGGAAGFGGSRIGKKKVA